MMPAKLSTEMMIGEHPAARIIFQHLFPPFGADKKKCKTEFDRKK
jgi:hypothetical protein